MAGRLDAVFGSLGGVAGSTWRVDDKPNPMNQPNPDAEAEGEGVMGARKSGTIPFCGGLRHEEVDLYPCSLTSKI